MEHFHFEPILEVPRLALFPPRISFVSLILHNAEDVGRTDTALSFPYGVDSSQIWALCLLVAFLFPERKF